MKRDPPTTLTPELQLLLANRSPKLAEAIRRVVTDVRPCVVPQSRRASEVPLRGRRLDRLLGRALPEPVLSPTASKFGGIPYIENPSDLTDGRFIGQVNFAEVASALAAQGSPLPDGMPITGLIGVDLLRGPFRARPRWYPNPTEEQAVRPSAVETVAKYEADIGFRGGWSMRGLEWFDAVPDEDRELWDAMNDLEIPGVDEDAHNGHKLFGHANEALNEHYGFKPVRGRSESIRDYALIWRIDYDKAAGFSWGTNWLYVIIHRDDLRQGAFENAVVTGANA